MHDDSNVIVHVLANVTQEHTCNDRNSTECDTYVVYIWICICETLLARYDDVVPDREIAIDTRHVLNFVDKTCASELSNFSDDGDIKDIMSETCEGDFEGELGNEFIQENVVIGGVSNGASDDTNGEREGCNGCDQIVWADNGGDDGSRYDDSTDAEASDNEDTVDSLDVVQICYSKCTTSSCHHAGRDDHEPTVTSAEDGEQPKNDAGPDENGKADGHSAESDAEWVVAVNVEGLGGPEEQHREEIGTRDKGDYKSEGENTRIFA